MKTLPLLLMLGMVGAAVPAAARTYSVKNASKYTVRVAVSLVACKGDTLTIKPGDTASIQAGACLIKGISASVSAPATGNVAKYESSGTAYAKWEVDAIQPDGQKDVKVSIKRL